VSKELNLLYIALDDLCFCVFMYQTFILRLGWLSSPRLGTLQFCCAPLLRAVCAKKVLGEATGTTYVPIKQFCLENEVCIGTNFDSVQHMGVIAVILRIR
jgi:hypothetical protein